MFIPSAETFHAYRSPTPTAATWTYSISHPPAKYARSCAQYNHINVYHFRRRSPTTRWANWLHIFFLRNRSKVSFNLEEAKKALSGLVEQPTCLQLADARNHSIRSFFNCSLFQQTRRRTKASFLTLHPWNKTAKFLAYNNSWQLTDSSGETDNSVHVDHFRSNRRAKHFQARDECILDNGQHNKI